MCHTFICVHSVNSPIDVTIFSSYMVCIKMTPSDWKTKRWPATSPFPIPSSFTVYNTHKETCAYLDTFFHTVDLESTHPIWEWVDLQIKWRGSSLSFLEIQWRIYRNWGKKSNNWLITKPVVYVLYAISAVYQYAIWQKKKKGNWTQDVQAWM